VDIQRKASNGAICSKKIGRGAQGWETRVIIGCGRSGETDMKLQ
jgi:hypothetical protein